MIHLPNIILLLSILGLKNEHYKSEKEFCPIVNCEIDEAKRRCPKQCEEKQGGNKILIKSTILDFQNYLSVLINLKWNSKK